MQDCKHFDKQGMSGQLHLSMSSCLCPADTEPTPVMIYFCSLVVICVCDASAVFTSITTTDSFVDTCEVCKLQQLQVWSGAMQGASREAKPVGMGKEGFQAGLQHCRSCCKLLPAVEQVVLKYFKSASGDDYSSLVHFPFLSLH